MGHVTLDTLQELIEGACMPDAGSRLAVELRERLREAWGDVIDPTVASWLRRDARETPAQTRRRSWDESGEHIEAWSERQAASLRRRHPQAEQWAGKWADLRGPAAADAATAERRLRQAALHLVLVRRLADEHDKLAPETAAAIRERLWSDLEPQVRRAASGFGRSAARRGFEEADLVQDAAAHFQQVVTRFDPSDRRKAMFATWFDDVVTNLFLAAVRPRKSDVFHRGRGGYGDDLTEDDAGTGGSVEPLREVHDQRRRAALREALGQVDEILCDLLQSGTCRFEQVLAFRLYYFEGLTYQEVARALRSHGHEYGTTQMFNFVKDVRDQVVKRTEGDPFAD
jgi:RNA polymerase sigma factor (sigma-70 family)